MYRYISMTNYVPADTPNSPQYNGKTHSAATNTTTTNEVNGSVMVNDFVEGETNIPEPFVDNPYTIEGGGNIYNVFYKHLLIKVGAKNLMDAVDKGYMRMYDKVGGFSDRKNVVLGVQRLNENRDNHIYKYNVRKVSVKHPEYKYKIKITKN